MNGASWAFIFDVDGVLLDNETRWDKQKNQLFERLLEPEVLQRMGQTSGLSLDDIYRRGAKLGTSTTKAQFKQAFFDAAPKVYGKAPLTRGLNYLSNALIDGGFKIGIVTASPQVWVQTLLDRLPFRDRVDIFISLYDLDHLAHKPAPDGYLEAMRRLASDPSHTIVLEDSNSGIASAKASGAYTIGLKQNLIPGYKQTGADVYAGTLSEVIAIVNRRVKSAA